MERIRRLNRYQKSVLIFMAAISVLSFAIYSGTISRIGFEYQDTILVQGQENGDTVYAGKIEGRQAKFTVSEDQTVLFQYGDKTFGPYRAREDPTAIPKNEEMAEDMVGVELLQGDSLLFRGGVLKLDEAYLLYNEDGSIHDFETLFTVSGDTETAGNETAADPEEPSAAVILALMDGPKLTHKGSWFPWLCGVLVCALNALSILFADELFRFQLLFQIRNADRAEPSGWELAERYIGWTAVPIAALIILAAGL